MIFVIKKNSRATIDAARESLFSQSTLCQLFERIVRRGFSSSLY